MDKGIDRVVVHTMFSLEATNLVFSKGYWDAAWRQQEKVIRKFIFQKCPGIIIFHCTTSAFGSLVTQLTQREENSQ